MRYELKNFDEVGPTRFRIILQSPGAYTVFNEGYLAFPPTTASEKDTIIGTNGKKYRMVPGRNEYLTFGGALVSPFTFTVERIVFEQQLKYRSGGKVDVRMVEYALDRYAIVMEDVTQTAISGPFSGDQEQKFWDDFLETCRARGLDSQK